VEQCERALIDRIASYGDALDGRKSLRDITEWDEPWNVSSDSYHAEANLCAAVDTLCFERASQWLEYPMTPERLFREWRREHHAPG